MDFLNVKTLDEAMQYSSSLGSGIRLGVEQVALEGAIGRYLAEPIFASEDLPAFNRATVDGYAVRHEDVSGANESLPSILKMIGTVEMGASCTKPIAAGEAIYVPTGGQVPEGADAVVMIEYCDCLEKAGVMVYQPVHYGENISWIGDDVKSGQRLLAKGHRLGAHDIGLLAGLGVHTVTAFRPLRVSICSTGDELVDVRTPLKPGKIRDINGYALAAQAREDGCDVVRQVIVPDDFDLLYQQVKTCLSDSDLILLSGGSSAGTKDHTKAVITAMPEGRLWTHGLAIKPGKPTLIGTSGQTPIIGLPGHPSAALLLYQLIAQEIIGKSYATAALRPLTVEAKLTTRVHAAPGKDTYVMVQLAQTAEGMTAQPIHGKSGLISLMAKTCGYFKIAQNHEGLEAGTLVRTHVIHPQLIRQEV